MVKFGRMDVDKWEDERVEFQSLLDTSTIINLPTVSILESTKNINHFINIFEESYPEFNFKVVQKKSAVSEILMMDVEKKNQSEICQEKEYKHEQLEEKKLDSECKKINLEENLPLQNSDQNSNLNIFRIRKPRKIIKTEVMPIMRTTDHQSCEDVDGSTSPSPEVFRAIEEDNPIDFQDYFKQYSNWVEDLQKEEDEKDESSTKILHRLRMSNIYTHIDKSPELTHEVNLDK